jgi:hypothetical protein
VTTNSITLSWNAVSGATSYTLGVAGVTGSGGVGMYGTLTVTTDGSPDLVKNFLRILVEQGEMPPLPKRVLFTIIEKYGVNDRFSNLTRDGIYRFSRGMPKEK